MDLQVQAVKEGVMVKEANTVEVAIIPTQVEVLVIICSLPTLQTTINHLLLWIITGNSNTTTHLRLPMECHLATIRPLPKQCLKDGLKIHIME